MENCLSLLAPSSSFASLGLSEPTLEALARAGFTAPTPIQQQAIPPGLSGRDVIGCAATGTGKTAAFLLPIIERLSGKRGSRALVLAPTRELTLQILEQLKLFGSQRGVRGAAIIGGAAFGPQERDLREQREVIVATPGRLVDHLQQGTARLDRIEILVLDEADRMLDMGFKPQLDRILARLPQKRQSLLFSATIGGEVAGFAKKCLHDPVRVEVAKSGTVAKGATQCAYLVNEADKPALLMSLISDNDESTLVFTRTQHRADKLAKVLNRMGLDVARIHGGRSQAQRQHALKGFKSGDYRILVATDIAARGIDVVGIGHVVNYDLSRVPEDHVHRIGRTARADAVGRASSLVSREEFPLLKDIEKFIRGPIPRTELPNDLRDWTARINDARAEAQQRSPHRAGPKGHSHPSSRPHHGGSGGGRSHGSSGGGGRSHGGSSGGRSHGDHSQSKNASRSGSQRGRSESGARQHGPRRKSNRGFRTLGGQP